MRRYFVAQIAWFAGLCCLHQLVQFPNLLLQQIDLLLLTKHRAIQLFEMILAEIELEFEFGNSRFHIDFPVIPRQRAPLRRPLLIATSIL